MNVKTATVYVKHAPLLQSVKVVSIQQSLYKIDAFVKKGLLSKDKIV